MKKQKKSSGNIILTGVIFILASMFAVSAGVMLAMFGFEYTSLLSLFLFFAVIFVANFPIRMFSKGLPNSLVEINKISPKNAKILFILLNTLTLMFAMITLDIFMENVAINGIAILIIAILLSL